MAFPTIPTAGAGRVIFSTSLDTSGGTVTSPDMSTLTKASGNLLIAIVVTYDGNSTNAEFSSWGGGFTEFKDQAGTATMGIGLAYKWSTGSETGTFTVAIAGGAAGNDAAFFVIAIPGAHSTTPPEATNMATGTGTAADPASLSPSWGAEDTLWIAVVGNGEDATTGSFTGVTAAPTNYVNFAQSGITADVVGGIEADLAFRQLNAASEDVGAFTLDTTNARSAALLIAVRPVPAAENHNGTISVTGGGILTHVFSGQHNRSGGFTGGGIYTQARTGQHNATVSLTGGGIVTAARSGQHNLAQLLTGGGILTWNYSVSTGAENHNGTFVLVGGGILLAAASGQRQAPLALTGGGILTRATTHNRNVAAFLTGGGIWAASTGTQRVHTDADATAGGILQVAERGSHLATVNLTGGGIIIITSAEQPVALTGLSACMDAIAQACVDGNVTERAYGWPVQAPQPPCVVVGYPQQLEFDVAFGRGADRCIIPVYFLAGRVVEKAARDEIGSIIAGATGIKDALDGDLGGEVQTLRVQDMRIINVQVNGIDYLAAEFMAEVFK